MASTSILLVTADREVIGAFRRFAAEIGADLRVAPSLRDAAATMTRRSFDVLFVQMDGASGQIRQCLADGFVFMREPPVIAVSKKGSIPDAVRAIRAGACQYLPETPQDAGTVGRVLRRVLSTAEERGTEGLSGRGSPVPFDGFITADHRVIALCRTVARVADLNVILLVEGETGTGKSLLARKVHENSARRFGPFFEVNCGALTESLFESELFGLAGGDVSDTESCGKLELADGGTILLKEVTEAPLSVMARVLDVVRSKRIKRPGGGPAVEIDVRTVLTSKIRVGRSRMSSLLGKDVAQRSGWLEVELPPLRERVGDIPLLAQHFVKVFGAEHGRKVTGVAAEALSKLVRYHWPGNVRELRNAMEHAVILSREEIIGVESLSPSITESSGSGGEDRLSGEPFSLKTALCEPERRYILEALRASGWNKQHAAKKLQISRSTLYKKIKQHGLPRDGSLSDSGGIEVKKGGA